MSSYKDWVTVEPVAFLAIFGLYIEFPAIQDLIYTQTCVQTVTRYTEKNHSISFNTTIIELCDRFNRTLIPAEWQTEINDNNSIFWLRYSLVICLICVLSIPYWGGLSDRIGRIGPISVPLVAATVCNSMYVLYALAMHMWPGLSLEWLMVGALITGLSGGQAVIIINSFGYISETTDQESRSKRITILEAIIFVSNSVGFFLNGYTMKLSTSLANPLTNRHLVTFSLVVALNVVAILYTFLRLRHHRSHIIVNNFEREQHEIVDRPIEVAPSPPALPREHCTDRVPPRTSSASPANLIVNETDDARPTLLNKFITLQYYANVYQTLTRKRESRLMIHGLLLAAFISASSLAVTMSLMYNFVRREPFLWTTSDYSHWNAWSSVSRGVALVSLSLAMRFSPNWNVPDALVSVLGFASRGAGLAMIGLAQSSSTINFSLVVSVASEFNMPPIRSILSKLVPHNELCKVYSCIGASQSLCFALGNVIFYAVYASILKDMNFFRYSLVGSACAQAVAMIIMICVYRGLRQRLTTC